jgi:hypothetical protein
MAQLGQLCSLVFAALPSQSGRVETSEDVSLANIQFSQSGRLSTEQLRDLVKSNYDSAYDTW